MGDWSCTITSGFDSQMELVQSFLWLFHPLQIHPLCLERKSIFSRPAFPWEMSYYRCSSGDGRWLAPCAATGLRAERIPQHRKLRAVSLSFGGIDLEVRWGQFLRPS